VRRINWRKAKGPMDWTAHHTAYIALWNMRESSHMYYLHAARHRRGPWLEYRRWLQHQSRLFLRLAYTQDDIAHLPDSDGDNEIVNEYDEITWGSTILPDHAPFQNYVVNIFPYFYCVWFLTLKFLIVTIVV
jgi:hypothetical protein